MANGLQNTDYLQFYLSQNIDFTNPETQEKYDLPSLSQIF